MNLHPAISYELSQARIADWRRQAQRERLARAAVRPQSRAPRPKAVLAWHLMAGLVAGQR